MKNYAFTTSEFFYDSSFSDYHRNYILLFNEKIDDVKCPRKVILQSSVNILTHKPIDDSLPLLSVVGNINDVRSDRFGVFGNPKFISAPVTSVMKNLMKKGFVLHPFGTMIYSNHNEIIEYVLRGVYLKFI